MTSMQTPAQHPFPNRLQQSADAHEHALRELAGVLARVLDSRVSGARLADREAIADHLSTLGYDDSHERFSYVQRIITGKPAVR